MKQAILKSQNLYFREKTQGLLQNFVFPPGC